MPTKRERIIQKYGGLCQICGKETTDSDAINRYKDFPELDHIIPKSHGGSNKEENLSLVCNGCNNKKRNTYGVQTINRLIKCNLGSISRFDLQLLHYEFTNGTIDKEDLDSLKGEIIKRTDYLTTQINQLTKGE